VLRALTFGASAIAVDALTGSAPANSRRPASWTGADLMPPDLIDPTLPDPINVSGWPKPIEVENRSPGTKDWHPEKGADDRKRQIQGYASATSVRPGDRLDFHVSVDPARGFRISFYRLGWYGGAGARHLLTSPPLPGVPQPVPSPDAATGLITCDWPAAWTLRVPNDWTSGLYVAVFATPSGSYGCTPFVVRDDRRAGGLCVVLPFTTYQAYNQWPMDGRIGKSLYYGYQSNGKKTASRRALQVSFDRPYAGDGQPMLFDRDHDFIQWVERQSYDVTYATSVDLHAGRIDPARYRGLIFCGHDEYWSLRMRLVAQLAAAKGSSLAFLTADNIYWQIRMQESNDGRPNRLITCCKDAPDPWADAAGRTARWRDVDPTGARAEQGLLGVQYKSMVADPQPLVIQSADHWFWTGCGLTDGDQIPNLVGGEADGLQPQYPQPSELAGTVLSASPYRDSKGRKFLQNASVYETPSGGVVFTAGTFFWPMALNREGFRDARIQTATANLLDRMIGGSGPANLS
jgi:hypothetical protein